MFGYIIGGFTVSLLLPVLILIVTKFVGPMKRSPGIVYSVCGLLAPIPCALAASVSHEWGAATISVGLALLVLWWGYTRDRKALSRT
jgi:hypothetical protein